MKATRTCTVDSCEAKHVGHGFCNKHLKRWHVHGNPLKTLPGGGARGSGPDHAMWRGDQVTYAGFHQRLRVLRGPATNHACEHCGRPATHWAYNHSDPHEIAGEDRGKPRPFSTDPNCYLSLCVPCHKRFDLAAKQ